MALATLLAPYTTPQITPLLATTATTAASFCNQGANNTQCTMWWTNPAGPATLGVGPQMSALNVFNANMVQFMRSAGNQIATSDQGGTSQGNPNAGVTNSDQLVTYFPFLMKLM
jgi:mannan endo-1,6-alpha-mannosidase